MQSENFDHESNPNNLANKGVFASNNSNGDLNRRVGNLEDIVTKLTEQLTISNEHVSKLKR